MVDESSTLERMARVETKVDFIIARLDTLPPSPACVLRHQELDTMLHEVSERVSNIESLRNKIIGGALALNVVLVIFMDKIKKLLGVVPLLVLLLLPFATLPTLAHDWYTGKHDPVTGGSCCSTSKTDGYGDCHQLVVEAGVLEPVPEGYRLRLTLDQARKINPLREYPVDTLIPEQRIQASEDGNFHLCIPPRPAGFKFDFYCFWAPPST